MVRKKCEHGRQKYQCKDCGGSGICDHGKFKSICVDCGGSSFCKHKIQKATCKDCGGSVFCDHGKIKQTCKDCGGSAFCDHGKQKSHCKECGGSQICDHGKQKSHCKECGGSQICDHGNQKAHCKECGGSQICDHGKWKTLCIECGGSALCKTELCETRANSKYNGHCLRCFIHLFPGTPVSRNYKTKEKYIADIILNKFSNYTWSADKKVPDGCSKRRPDLLLDLGSQVIIIEIDEHAHNSYDTTCENKRIMEISKDLGHRPIVLIRFNPDSYVDILGKKIPSCFTTDKLGISIPKKDAKEMNKRVYKLIETITHWTIKKSEMTINTISLFF